MIVNVRLSEGGSGIYAFRVTCIRAVNFYDERIPSQPISNIEAVLYGFCTKVHISEDINCHSQSYNFSWLIRVEKYISFNCENSAPQKPQPGHQTIHCQLSTPRSPSVSLQLCVSSLGACLLKEKIQNDNKIGQRNFLSRRET